MPPFDEQATWTDGCDQEMQLDWGKVLAGGFKPGMKKKVEVET